MKTPSLLSIATASAALFAAALTAHATFVDFDTVPSGPVTTIGGATFSLAGVGEMGTPTNVSYAGTGYLWNSSDGISYPTNTILRVDFTAGVSGIDFEYNTFGINGSPTQGWSLLNQVGGIIAQGAFTSGGYAYYNLTSYTGVYAIEWNNGGNNWLSGLDSLNYSTSVPDSGSTAVLMIGALFAFGALKRKNRQAA